jgi:hypothetical protein
MRTIVPAWEAFIFKARKTASIEKLPQNFHTFKNGHGIALKTGQKSPNKPIF